MGKQIETKIDRFDGGIVNDPRNPAENIARIISNFDIISSPRKMTPYRSSESGDGSASTSTKRNFVIARRTGTTYSVYALGVVSGANRAEVLYKDLTTGAANDLDDSDWAAPSANQSAAGATEFGLFVYYRRTGLIYGARAGTNIWAFSPTGTAWADSHRALTYTNIEQGIVHSKDDILYIPYYDNAGPTSAIASNNNGTWNNTALSLPVHYIPTSICEYGNYLAIGCRHTDGVSNSRVFLWDRDSTLSTLSESVDWGTGQLRILEEIDGELIGISLKNGTSSQRDRIFFRKLIGNRAFKFLELQVSHSGSANTTIIPFYKQKVDNRLYFQMLIEWNGAVRDGVWSIGRSSFNTPFGLVHERTSNNNTALATSDDLRGFFMAGDYLFQSYVAGGTHNTTKTNDANDSAPYNHNSVYESKIFDAGDPSFYKDLIEITVTTEPMPASGSLTLAYRVDQNTAWTTIFTNSTDNSISRTAVASLPKYYKQIQFRITTTGGDSQGTGSALGVEVTGLIFKEDITARKYNTA